MKLFKWHKYGHQLIKFQNKINQNYRDPRECRNFQRLLIRSSCIKLLIIADSLLNNISIDTFSILDQQWLLALRRFFYQKIKTQSNKYIVVYEVHNFFSKKNKFWILSHFSLEKKWFLSRLPFFTKHIKKKIKYLSIQDFGNYFCKYNNCFFAVGINLNSNCNFKLLAYQRGLVLKSIKTYWAYDFYKQINLNNIRVHQTYFQTYFKQITHGCPRFTRAIPIDQILWQLNQKIIFWQNHFCLNSKLFNNYFFWRIWYCLKKRHKNKTSKWLYKKYWHKSTSSKWILCLVY